MPFREIQDGGHVLCTVSKFRAFPGRFALQTKQTENDLLTYL